MAVQQGTKPVFCYAYRPLLRATGTDDGGFTVNLMENGLLVFDVFSAHRQITREYTFTVPLNVVTRYQQEVRRAGWWLNSMKLHMAANPQPMYASIVCLDGWPEPFRFDDLPLLVNAPFRSERGHYARMMFNLLEDIAGMLAGCGVDLQLDSFQWDHNRILSFEEQQMANSGSIPMQMYG